MKSFTEKRLRRAFALMLCVAFLFAGSFPARALIIEAMTVEQLVEAILTANATPQDEDTIVLTANGRYILSDAYIEQTGLPPVTSPIRIEGNGALLAPGTLAGSVRIFLVESNGQLILSNLNLTNGKAASGGAVVNHGVLDLRYCRLSDNQATGHGGAIYNVTLPEKSPARTALTGCDLSGNRSLQGYAGAVYNLRGTVEVSQSTLSGNTAVNGGALYGYDAVTHVYDSTLAGNRATGLGGAIYNTGPAVLTMVNSTLSGNEAGTMGGAIANINHAMATLTSCSLIDNRAPQGLTAAVLLNGAKLTMAGSLVANPASPAEACHIADAGIMMNSGINLATDASCGAEIADFASLKLGPLAGNGSSTMTHALLPWSTALEYIPPADAQGLPLADQRGRIRPQDADGDGNVFFDVGAFEGDSFVTIDIQPKDPLNIIRLSHKDFDVLVKSTGAFDPAALTTTDMTSMNIMFGPSWVWPTGDFSRWNKLASHQVREGLLLHFLTAESGLGLADTEGCVTIAMSDGRLFRGCDAVVVRR